MSKYILMVIAFNTFKQIMTPNKPGIIKFDQYYLYNMRFIISKLVNTEVRLYICKQCDSDTLPQTSIRFIIVDGKIGVESFGALEQNALFYVGSFASALQYATLYFPNIIPVAFKINEREIYRYIHGMYTEVKVKSSFYGKDKDGHISSMNNELSYLELLSDVIQNGTVTPNRTGIDTYSVFGRTLRFPLETPVGDKIIPLLTTRRVCYKHILSELLSFVKGYTNTDYMKSYNNPIWDGNTSKQFHIKSGHPDYEEGELGPSYGWQWRNYNAPYTPQIYKTEVTSEPKKGVDQLGQLIRSIKSDPSSRRHLMVAWNPCQLDEMALPPCHYAVQFKVTNGVIDCLFNMRSCDVGIGLPFNIASYATLTHMVAMVCGLRAGELMCMLCDTHIYENQVSNIMEQLKRKVNNTFPYVRINAKENIDDFEMNDFELLEYTPYPAMKFVMAV